MRGQTELKPGLRGIFLRNPAREQWLHFDDPVDVLATREPSRVLEAFMELERRVRRERLFAAGFLTYEAAPGFDDSFRTRPAGNLPLMCFGLFGQFRATPSLPGTGAATAAATAWRTAEPRQDYFDKIAAIQDRIRAGDTYQINYTTRKVAEGVFDPFALFSRVAADAPYAAWVELDDYAIACASPELFFRLQRDRITCQPMKGTVSRGMTLAQDRAHAAWLGRSGKNRAENVMIADMVRNDLGRIAVPGSVTVPELFTVQRHATVWQMISTVRARTDAPVAEILRALFPSASVTGAPKVSSMRLIETLENDPRDVYTGTIGYLAPDRQAQFNVAIRTALINKRTGTAFYGVGSGIVADSEAESEFAECQAKAKILSLPPRESQFALLETMLWTPENGLFLLEYHLKRIADSARYFGFDFDPDAARQALASLVRTLDGQRVRIRLLQPRHGALRLEHSAVSAATASTPAMVGLARQPIDPDDPFLYHKTTRRQFYERALASVAGCDDVLLWNPDGFLTETSIANIVVEIAGQRVTPPVSCGLLGGTYRQWLLDRGEILERKIHKDELSQPGALSLINSVRGETQARLVTPCTTAGAATAATSTRVRRHSRFTAGDSIL